jgi:enamine deaminase RidA (YjgF/YER057c/UK114 family)
MRKHREVIEVQGLHHGSNPTPPAVRVGNMVFSSGIFGMDPATGTVPDEPALQVEHVFRHMRTIVENAGGGTGDIAFVLFRIRDDAVRGLVNDAWLELFPDDDSRPARNTQVDALGWNQVIHVMMTAVLP